VRLAQGEIVKAAFEAVARVLDEAGVRYLVAGGLAVIAHGYLRLTVDIDLVIALDQENILAAFAALAKQGYHPSVPITAGQFADSEQRQRWMTEKNMKVLNFFSDRYPESSIDVFVYEPFDFDAEYQAAMTSDLLPNVRVRFVSIPTLIQMKEVRSSPRDLDDIQHLRWILDDKGRE
jgi:hypothetical protein